MEHTPLKEEEGGVLVWWALPPVRRLVPDSVASTGQRIWCIQPGQVPETAYLPSSRLGAYILFATGSVIWLLPWFPP